MAGDIATLGLEVNAKGVEDANKQLDALAVKAGQAEKSAGDLNNSTKNLTGSLGGLGGALGKVASLMGVAFSVVAIKNAADSWSDLTSRVSIAVGGQEKMIATMAKLQEVARGTYMSINATTESFLGNQGVLKELGKSTQDAINYTESLNNAFVVSGLRGQQMEVVMNAMNRAMGAGKLSGNDLNTVLMNGGRVTQALADHLKVAQLDLRKMGAEGKLTAKVLYDALVGNGDKLREEAASMPATWQDVGTGWSNAFTIIIGSINQAVESFDDLAQYMYDMSLTVTGYAGSLSQFFIAVKMVASDVASVIGDAASTMSSWFASIAGEGATASAALALGIGLATTAALGLAAALIGPVVGALSAVAAAVLLNPVGLLVGAFAAVVAAAFIFRDELTQIIGVDIISEVKRSVNIIIGAFVAAYQTVVKYWENLPQAFSIIGKKAWNAFVSAFEGESLWIEAFGQKFTLFDGLDLSKFKTEISDDSKAISEDLSKIWDTSMATNYVGEVTAGLGKVWESAGAVADKFKEIDTNLGGDGSGGGGALGDADGKGKKKKKKDSAAEKLKKEMEDRLKVLTEALRSEEDLLAEKYLKDLETLNYARENEKISQDQYNQYKLDVERKFQEDMNAVKLQQLSGALSATADFFGAMSSLQSGGNEKMLKAQKIFAAASALVDTYAGAAKVLNDPTVPFWGKFAAVAAVVAKGMSLVAAIKSGGNASGGGGSGGSSTSAAPQSAPPKPTQMAEIKIHGEVFGREQVIDLVEKINDVQKDGHMINWSYA